VDVWVWVWVWVFVLVSVRVDWVDVGLEPSEDVVVSAASVALASAVCASDAAPESALLACCATVPAPPDPQPATTIAHTTAAVPNRGRRTMNLARDPATAHLRRSRAIRTSRDQCQGARYG
jgi:hypothetical protein